MRRTLSALSLAMLSVAVVWPATSSSAQDTRIARGTVTDIGTTVVVVKVRDAQMIFSVDNRTRIDAPGASTKAQQASVMGKPGPHLGDLLRTGEGVAVTYHDDGGALRASAIRALPAGAIIGSIADASVPLASTGTVKAIGAASLTIVGSSGGGARFTQTFGIDPDTTVIGKGAGTKAAANGGHVPLTDLVGSGDTVRVSYRKGSGGTLHASDVRLMLKARK